MDAIRDPGDFGLPWRSNWPEYRFALAVVYMHAVQCREMVVGIEIKGIAEALNEADGAAARLAV
jgi:hypothetical protein